MGTVGDVYIQMRIDLLGIQITIKQCGKYIAVMVFCCVIFLRYRCTLSGNIILQMYTLNGDRFLNFDLWGQNLIQSPSNAENLEPIVFCRLLEICKPNFTHIVIWV